MSDFIQIGLIEVEVLSNSEQKEFISNLPDDQNRNFVEVIEGDASRAYVIDENIYNIDELIGEYSDYCDSHYVLIDGLLTTQEDIRKLATTRGITIPPFSGTIYFKSKES